MTIWDDAVADLHANADFAEPVRWVPPSGPAVETTAILYKPEEAAVRVQGTGGHFLRLGPAAQDVVWVAELRRSVVALPVTGGRLVGLGGSALGTRTYPVRAVDQVDEGTGWALALGPPS